MTEETDEILFITDEGTLTLTPEQADRMFYTYDHFDWDKALEGLPADARDRDGELINRDNMNLKKMIMCQAFMAENFSIEEAFDKMNYYFTNYPDSHLFIGVLIDSFEDWKKAQNNG